MVGAGVLMADPQATAFEDQGARSPGQEAHEKSVHTALYKALMAGIYLYDDGNHTAAAYVFQGAATALEPLLDYHPNLQKALRKGLEDARATPNTTDRARMLHHVLMDAYDRTTDRGHLKRPPIDRTTTLWERMGGEEGVTKIVHEFIEKARKNERVNFTRNGEYLKTDEEVKALERKFVLLASALGKGPYKWEGPTMKKVHEKMRITDDEFDALRIDLRFVLLDHITSEDVEFILAGVDSTRRDIVSALPAGRPPKPALDKTLVDLMGGKEKVQKIMDKLIDRLADDKSVNFSRDGKYPMDPERKMRLKEQFFELTSAIGKDAGAYKGKSLIDAHKEMGITDAEYDAFVKDVDKVLSEEGVNPGVVQLVKTLLERKRKEIVGKPGKAASAPPARRGFARSSAPEDNRVRVSAAADTPTADGMQSLRVIVSLFLVLERIQQGATTIGFDLQAMWASIGKAFQDSVAQHKQ
jgi:truncated hemoglobin YjbI